MKDLEMNLSVNIEDLDRLAIGARIYDKLDMSNMLNIFKPAKEGIAIREKDIIDIIKLINEESLIGLDKEIIIKK